MGSEVKLELYLYREVYHSSMSTFRPSSTTLEIKSESSLLTASTYFF